MFNNSFSPLRFCAKIINYFPLLKGLVIGFLLLGTLSVHAQDFYWRGGSGKWSEPANWSSSSGGIPTALDNVIFDINSFSANGQNVTIDKDAVCKSIDWSDVDKAPRLVGQSSLTVYGSMTLSETMTVLFSGDIYFKAKKNENAIDLAGQQLKSNLNFDGKGKWIFTNDIDIGQKDVTLIKGVIDTKGKNLSCGSFYSTGHETREIKLNASTLKITGYNGRWIVTNSLILQKGNAKIEFNNPSPLSNAVFKGGLLNYYRVETHNNIVVLGNNNFDYLKLNAGISCAFESGKTQTINQNFAARGCAGLIRIKSTGDDFAVIKKGSGNIEVSFVSLQNIKANMGSGGQFNAYNSLDDGNNQACSITANPRNMRWENGTGNWSDTTHWNAVNKVNDSKCVPMPYDNIVFDGNSFSGTDTVKVDLIDANCNDLFWNASENAVLVNLYDSSQITVYGSLQFAQQMQNNYKGEFSFRDTIGNSFIQPNGVAFAGDIDFSGENGSWELKDGLETDGIICFQKGTLNSNSYPISCNSFISDSAFSRTLNLGESTLKINNSSRSSLAPGLSLNNENLQFNQSKLKIEMTGEWAKFKVYGGDTIHFHQLSFTNTNGSTWLWNLSSYSIFQKVVFAGNASIYGNNMFDIMSLSKACVYSLQSGRTQTINDKIIAPVSCEGTLILKSISNGSAANLKKQGDTLLLEHISLRDIRVVSPAVYIAKNAVDLGNNIGWTEISGTEKRELFWVGGPGDWNDSQHWSLYSNGAGGECVPTTQDIVSFDQNSFSGRGDRITVDKRNAFAYDLYWSDAVDFPVFSADEYTTLWIFGSIDLPPNMAFRFQGEIHFESSEPGKTIKTNGNKLHNKRNSIFFNGLGGEWTLLDGLDIDDADTLRNYIYLIRGSLITNSQPISCYYFYTPYKTQRGLSLGSSDISTSYWYLDGRNMQMQEHTSHIQIGLGDFYQRNASNIQYHDVSFTAASRKQSLFVNTTDTIQFRNISFNNGCLSGLDSYVLAENIEFAGTGAINIWDTSGMNVCKIDKLVFKASGEVFGNDTIGELHFKSDGLIRGDGIYSKAYFSDDGNIIGSNTFGTLDFSPGHVYQLSGGETQTITDQFNIWGNNCESIWLQSTDEEQAEVFKSTGEVHGDFIEMTNIKASGGASFDAGSFSNDLNFSNTGWEFHENPLRYKLDSISINIGDTLFICASNFNAGPDATYLWQKYPEGDTVGMEFCLELPPYSTGYYTLKVYYDEGTGCMKDDSFLWGCFYSLDIDKNNVSCYGNKDGSFNIEVVEATGNAPYQYLWFHNDDLIASTPRVDSLQKGVYSYSVTDNEGCTFFGNSTIDEPEAMAMDFNVDYNQNTIEVEVNGGIYPYTYDWESGSIDYFTDILEVGEYIILVTDSNNCTKSGSVFVDNRFNVIAPNAFSPNGDGLNDYFELFWQGPEIFNYQMDIFSSWGNPVFSTDNYDEFWNGKLFNSGDMQPVGVYPWRLVVVSYDGKQIISQGTVTLLR